MTALSESILPPATRCRCGRRDGLNRSTLNANAATCDECLNRELRYEADRIFTRQRQGRRH